MSTFEVRAIEELDSFESKELAVELAKLAGTAAVKKMLNTRHLWTAKATLSTPDKVSEMLDKSLLAANERRLWMTAFYDLDTGKPIGAGTLIPKIPLRSLVAPIPPFPGLRSFFMADANAVTGANVTAWVDPRRENSPAELREGYEALGQLASYRYEKGDIQNDVIWTVEPFRAQAAYNTHDVLDAAGLIKTGQGFYDDGEKNWHPVLKSGLFVGPADKSAPQ